MQNGKKMKLEESFGNDAESGKMLQFSTQANSMEFLSFLKHLKQTLLKTLNSIEKIGKEHLRWSSFFNEFWHFNLG